MCVIYRRKVTEEHFDTTKTNPRFTAYLLANGLKPGDTWITYEFMRWASAMATEYRKERGLSEGEHHNQAELTEWIKEKAVLS